MYLLSRVFVCVLCFLVLGFARCLGYDWLFLGVLSCLCFVGGGCLVVAVRSGVYFGTFVYMGLLFTFVWCICGSVGG